MIDFNYYALPNKIINKNTQVSIYFDLMKMKPPRLHKCCIQFAVKITRYNFPNLANKLHPFSFGFQEWVIKINKQNEIYPSYLG